MPKELLATTIILATILASVVSTIGVEVVDARPTETNNNKNYKLFDNDKLLRIVDVYES